MRHLLAVLPLLLVACAPGTNASFQGCKTMSATAKIPVTPAIDTLQLKRTASGLGIQDLLEGTGKTAEPGNMVSVHYTGWLTDGTKVDSSRDLGQVFTFMLGRGQVIAGWDEGVAGMKLGGRRKLLIPSQLGYGAQGSGSVVPPGATLVFDVELCGVK